MLDFMLKFNYEKKSIVENNIYYFYCKPLNISKWCRIIFDDAFISPKMDLYFLRGEIDRKKLNRFLQNQYDININNWISDGKVEFNYTIWIDSEEKLKSLLDKLLELNAIEF